ncbi:TolC family outer membrane protein [Marinobacter sp. 2_MG-2023]|uniref:TolC family outer membrane protein n=1 Tax=Marinobacter sp. 2_MG-2023 TaxID=3062679 RepID=UPI0026E3DF0F|nr:TolC family outer membrane protein [Marinobacter sp. 2_MG-2023]MDO6441355.1 TolC family outer membrane protein [Marinobacter sp. 2_MG-2023]
MSIVKQVFKSGVAVCFGAIFLVPALAAQGQSNAGVINAVRAAIETNPEVRASWHQFLVAGHDTDSAFGGYLPSLDAQARYGLEHRNYGPVDEYDGYDGQLTLTQMLYDGFEVKSSVQRLEEQQLVSYFQLLAQIEKTSLEALGAYLDVSRQRELLDLARENLETHQEVYDQVSSSARAGVARAADLEQISGRLSLAESNLVVVASNLHDVRARYLRIVGEAPPVETEEVALDADVLPSTVNEALMIAYEGNPEFRASHRDIKAAEASVRENRSGYQPRLDLVASYGHSSYDDLGFDQSETEGRIGIELNVNLYRGGSDRARVRSAYDQVNVAKDLRDKACVDIRQEIQIAFNDVRNLETQAPILNNHRLSSARVRTAYKDQFDIGERTLLDLLDAENEYFDASRAYTNAIYDRKLAVATVQAGMGHLVSSLGLIRDGLPTLDELGAEPLQITEGVCPAVEIDESLELLLDFDGDGVRNYKDQCPGTPPGTPVDAEGCATAAKPVVVANAVVEFANDSARIEASSDEYIEEVGKLLAQNLEATVVVIGHASKTGAPAYNQALSIRRAEAVAQRLVDGYSIDPARIKTEGLGFYQPRFSMNTSTAVNANRRADIRVSAPGPVAEAN